MAGLTTFAEGAIPLARCVLIVEDNENDVFFIKRAFEKCGIPMQFVVAQDGLHACELLSAQCFGPESESASLPALMLLDLEMPKMTGLEILAWLRAMQGFEAVPVVVLTDSPELEIEESARRLGAVDYVRKPSDPAMFVSQIQELHTRWLEQCEVPDRQVKAQM